MDDKEIALLRAAVAEAKATGARIFWHSPDGSMHHVTSVPTKPLDPDRTGIPEIVALLDRGHLDLDGCNPDDFLIVTPLFDRAVGESIAQAARKAVVI